MNPRRWHLSSLGRRLSVALLVGGVVYVGLALSPSSYGVVLARLGLEGGPIIGIARDIRSDEYAVATPFAKAAVRNGFHRLNLTSPYRDDLRTFFPLPIADWGTLFRPMTAGYFVLPPANAYAFSFYALFALFIGGYYLWFCELGFTPPIALLLTLLLYLTGFVQYWWTDFTPVLAWYPWLYLALVRPRVRLAVYGAGLYYVACCFLLTWFYPPLQLSLIPITAVLLWTCHRDRFDRARLAVAAGALVGAAATAAVYMWTDMTIMRDSIYPGQRSYSGGTVPLRFWLGHFFPWIGIEQNRSLLAWNICEVGMVGTLLPVTTLLFGDWTSARWTALRHRWAIVGLLSCFVALSIWMLVPIPSRWAHLIGLDIISPRRAFFASGLALLLASAWLFVHVPLRVTVVRWSGLAVVILGVTYAAKVSQGLGWWSNWPDWILLALVAPVAFGAGSFAAGEGQRKAVVLLAMLLPQALTFGAFNPVQPAAPIFRPLPEPLAEALTDPRLYDRQGHFVYPLAAGAVANGLGLPSIQHVQLRPEFRLFRPLFPDLSDSAYAAVFNRYAHVTLRRDGPPAVLQADVVQVPASAFGVTLPGLAVRQDSISSWLPHAGAPVAGRVEQITPDEHGLTLSGWALMTNGSDTASTLVLHADRPLRVDSADALFRSDVVLRERDSRLGLSGFSLHVSWPETDRPTRLCVRSEDTAFGNHRVGDTGRDGCLTLPPP